MGKYILTHSIPVHPFSTPWKHLKTLRVSDVFRRQSKGAFGTNGLKCTNVGKGKMRGLRHSNAKGTFEWTCSTSGYAQILLMSQSVFLAIAQKIYLKTHAPFHLSFLWDDSKTKQQQHKHHQIFYESQLGAKFLYINFCLLGRANHNSDYQLSVQS